MSRLASYAPVIAALVCLAVGIHDACREPTAGENASPFAGILQPLAALPLPAGSAVALAVPAVVAARSPNAGAVFFEAIRQRPDLLWSPRLDAGPGSTRRYLVVVAPAPAPPRWRQLWQRGELTLFARPPA